MSEVKAHAEFGASSSERWLNCPGSIALSKKAPPTPENAYAKEGTLAHECLEFVLNNMHERKTIQFPEQFDYDMINYASEAAHWIKSQIKDGDIFHCETKVDATPFTCEGQFGTVDAAIVRLFDRLTVIDYKYGGGVVREPQGEDGLGDSQLVYYALGLSHQYHHNFTEIELVIIQPRAYHESGETIRSVVYPIEDILRWSSTFKFGVAACKEKNAPLLSGDWCRFCPAITICPKLKEEAMTDAMVVFANNEVEAVPEPKLIALPDLGRIMAACDKLEAWIEKVREHAEHVLNSGGEVEGYKLVNKRSIRRWVDPERVQDQAVRIFGPKVLTTPTLLSPAQFEKAVGKGNAEVFIEANASAVSSGTVMVKASDKRQAVNPAAQVFAVIEEDELDFL